MAFTRTTNQVINNAFYLIGFGNPNETIPGYYTDEAIYLLNALLDYYCAVERLIPYFVRIERDLTAGTANYFFGATSGIGNRISSIGQASVELNDNSYPLEQIKYFNLNGVTHNTNIKARPTTFILQNLYDGSEISLYPIPDRAYKLILMLKYNISNITDQTIFNEMPLEYHRFLTYALARELSSVFRIAKSWTPLLENEYQTMKKTLMSHADLELGVDGNKGQLNLLRSGYRFGTWNLGVIY